MNSWWGTTATTSIFIAAAITDWLDGYIARKVQSICLWNFKAAQIGLFCRISYHN